MDISDAISLFDNLQKEEISNSHGSVDMLIGMNYVSIQPRCEQTIEILALYGNRFGKCLAGSHHLLKGQNCAKVNLCQVNSGTSILEHFFSIEQMGVSCIPRCESCRCRKCPTGGKDYTIKEVHELKLIEDALVHKGDHWLAHYPWCKDPMLLPNNRLIVYKMLQSTEKNLTKDQVTAEIYEGLVNDMIERKVAQKLTKEEMLKYKGPVFYLSHHIATNQDSKSTPWRLVFNPSAQTFGHIINEYWAKGPNLLANLIQFREEVCAMICDIKKMFHAIKISVLDQNTHRFL